MKNKIALFDVLIVYTDDIAISAASKKETSIFPFPQNPETSKYNNSYAYFLNVCEESNLKVALTTSGDLEPDGHFKSYWLFKDNAWTKNIQDCVAPLIFDKFSPKNKTQKDRYLSLFSHREIEPFNSNKIFFLFSDKQKMYDDLSKFTIPTVTFKNGNKVNISAVFKRLAELLESHPNREDFSNEFIVKDRFGVGGSDIYKVEHDKAIAQVAKIFKRNTGKTFILQPFVRFDKGYGRGKNAWFTEIRIVYLDAKIIESYSRTAPMGDFLTNLHRKGGNIEFISEKEIPFKIKKMAKEILNILDSDDSLFALDFIISNNGNVYLMEGNSSPSVNWYVGDKKDEENSKKLIRRIVKKLLDKITIKKSSGALIRN